MIKSLMLMLMEKACLWAVILLQVMASVAEYKTAAVTLLVLKSGICNLKGSGVDFNP